MGYTIKEKYENADDWKEKAAAINFYHKLQKLTKPDHKLRDTAAYFGIGTSTVCEDILLAENIDFVGVCPSRKLAMAMLRNKSEAV